MNWWPTRLPPEPEFSIEVDFGNGVSFSASGSKEHVITAFAWFIDTLQRDEPSQDSAMPELPSLRAQKVGTC